jgi:hypothetical protein
MAILTFSDTHRPAQQSGSGDGRGGQVISIEKYRGVVFLPPHRGPSRPQSRVMDQDPHTSDAA